MITNFRSLSWSYSQRTGRTLIPQWYSFSNFISFLGKSNNHYVPNPTKQACTHFPYFNSWFIYSDSFLDEDSCLHIDWKEQNKTATYMWTSSIMNVDLFNGEVNYTRPNQTYQISTDLMHYTVPKYSAYRLCS